MKIISLFVALVMLGACTVSFETSSYAEQTQVAAAKQAYYRSVVANINKIVVTARELGRYGRVGPDVEKMVCFRHKLEKDVFVRLCTPEQKWESPQKPIIFTFEKVYDGLLMQTYRDVEPYGWWSWPPKPKRPHQPHRPPYPDWRYR